jgi:two-component system OmpR family response regulator
MRNLVLAEDSMTLRHLLVEALDPYGFEVHTVERGGDVLGAVHKHDPVVLVMNRMLPGKDGLAVLEELRGDDLAAHVRVLMLTDTDRRSEVVRALEQGTNDYVVKPFDPVDVARRVDKLARTAVANP